jgi:hypothetical protein
VVELVLGVVVGLVFGVIPGLLIPGLVVGLAVGLAVGVVPLPVPVPVPDGEQELISSATLAAEANNKPIFFITPRVNCGENIATSADNKHRLEVWRSTTI